MARASLTWQYWLFWMVFAVWLATAIPVIMFSLFTLELPLWPSFSEESTVEGVTVWAIYTAWFYLTPLVLVAIIRRKRMSASKLKRP